MNSSSILGTADPPSNIAFLVHIDNNKRADHSHLNSRNSKKDRPFCTHCNYHGHTIEKCYKLHGYPPSYKPKSKSQSIAINQVSTQLAPAESGTHENATSGQVNSLSNFLQSFNPLQYQHLMTMLSNHLIVSLAPLMINTTLHLHLHHS